MDALKVTTVASIATVDCDDSWTLPFLAVTSPKNPNLRPSEAGFILPLVLIIVAIGAMVVIGLLGYASGLLRAGGKDTDALQELYAADAGIAHTKKLLQQGARHNDISPIEVNGLEVSIRVIPVSTPGMAVPTVQPAPIDPLLRENLLGPHLVTLYSMPEGTKVDISWAFTLPTPTPTPTPDPDLTPAPTPTPTPIPTFPSLAIYAGLGGGTPIAITEPLTEVVPDRMYWRDIPARDRPQLELLDAEAYVVDFNPGTVRGLVSDAFTQECDNPTEPHFCLTTPPMDYIVVSKAGSTTVTAYLRQMPKWDLGYAGGINYTFSGGEVFTLSWKPHPPDE